jgi:hypothetical protein
MVAADTTVTSGPSWRIRDMAKELLTRRAIGPSSTKSNKQQTMSLSTHFDVDTCLARIRRDKAAVVRSSFEAAAICVLESLQKGEDDDAADNESVNEDDLPPILSDVKELETMRAVSLERAHDNKDVAKRKILKKEESAASPLLPRLSIAV